MFDHEERRLVCMSHVFFFEGCLMFSTYQTIQFHVHQNFTYVAVLNF